MFMILAMKRTMLMWLNIKKKMVTMMMTMMMTKVVVLVLVVVTITFTIFHDDEADASNGDRPLISISASPGPPPSCTSYRLLEASSLAAWHRHLSGLERM